MVLSLKNKEIIIYAFYLLRRGQILLHLGIKFILGVKFNFYLRVKYFLSQWSNSTFEIYKIMFKIKNFIQKKIIYLKILQEDLDSISVWMRY